MLLDVKRLIEVLRRRRVGNRNLEGQCRGKTKKGEVDVVGMGTETRGTVACVTRRLLPGACRASLGKKMRKITLGSKR